MAVSIVLIHEYWGLNAHIRDVAARFEAEGFEVVAVDLFDGQVTTDPLVAEALARALDRPAGIAKVIRAVQALRAANPQTKVATLGFCLGGGFALGAAAQCSDIAACVPFYGIGDQANVSKITAKIQGHFASDDPWCAPARVDALQRKLEAAKKTFEIHRYEASHAFFNDTRPEVYSAPNAKLAWERTLKFLNQI